MKALGLCFFSSSHLKYRATPICEPAHALGCCPLPRRGEIPSMSRTTTKVKACPKRPGSACAILAKLWQVVCGQQSASRDKTFCLTTSLRTCPRWSVPCLQQLRLCQRMRFECPSAQLLAVSSPLAKPDVLATRDADISACQCRKPWSSTALPTPTCLHGVSRFIRLRRCLPLLS